MTRNPDMVARGPDYPAAPELSWIPTLAFLFLVGAILAFYILTQRPGHDWGGDFALYLMHARNIAAFRDYNQTAFLYAPEAGVFSPRNYPPMLPVFLAPAVRAFGLNYFALRCVTSTLLVSSLIPFHSLIRRFLSPPLAICLVVLTAFAGPVLVFRDSISSEAPYMLFSFLALATATAAWQTGAFHGGSWGLAVWTGVLCAAAYLSRSVGLALIPALVLFEIARFRRIPRFSLIAGTVFVLIALGVDHFIHLSGGYAGQFARSPIEVIKHGLNYIAEFSYLWINGQRHPLRYATWMIFTVLAALGLQRSLRAGGTPADWYAIVFFGEICFYYVYNSRYLIPVMPVYLLWAAQGLSLRGERLPRKALLTVGLIALCLGGVNEALNAASLDRGPIKDGVLNADFQAAVAWLNREAPRDSVVISWNPRVIGLYTGLMSAGVIAGDPDLSRTLAYYRRIHVNLDVVFADQPLDQPRIKLIDAHPEIFQRVYFNPGISIYRTQLDLPALP